MPFLMCLKPKSRSSTGEACVPTYCMDTHDVCFKGIHESYIRCIDERRVGGRSGNFVLSLRHHRPAAPYEIRNQNQREVWAFFRAFLVDEAIVHYLPRFDEYLLSKKRANYAKALEGLRGRRVTVHRASVLEECDTDTHIPLPPPYRTRRPSTTLRTTQVETPSNPGEKF